MMSISGICRLVAFSVPYVALGVVAVMYIHDGIENVDTRERLERELRNAKSDVSDLEETLHGAEQDQLRCDADLFASKNNFYSFPECKGDATSIVCNARADHATAVRFKCTRGGGCELTCGGGQ